MKKLLLRLALSCLPILTLLSCAPSSHDPHWTHVETLQLNDQDYQRIYSDTVTPPNNPLIPPTQQSYTVSGILQGQYISALQGYYPCVNKLDTVTDECTLYYIYRFGQPIRFDHPDLQDYHIGDTLYLTGQVSYRMVNNDIVYYYCLGTHMHAVQPDCYCFEYQSIIK